MSLVCISVSLPLFFSFFTVSCFIWPTVSIWTPEKGEWSLPSSLNPSLCAKLLQWYATLCNPMDFSPVGSSIHGISQTRIMEWIAISFFGESFQPEFEPVSLTFPTLTGEFFTTSTSKEAQSSPCCCPVAQSCLTLCDPMDCSMPDFSVLHHLPEHTQTRVHWVDDAIQSSHPLSSPSLPTFNLSQHQGLFQWVGSSHQVAKGLELQLQHQSFQWIFRVDFLYDWLVWSPWSPRNSQHHISPLKKNNYDLGLSAPKVLSGRYLPGTSITRNTLTFCLFLAAEGQAASLWENVGSWALHFVLALSPFLFPLLQAW